MNIWKSLKELPRSMWLLTAATLINRTGTMVMPFLAIYLTKYEHIQEGQAGLVLMAYGFGSLAASPFVGRVADRIGKITVMEASLILSGFVLVFYSFVNNFILILVVTFIWAILSESFRPANLSLITEIVPPELRRQAFSLNRLAINLGMSIGPVVGGMLIIFNYHTMFYADAVTSIIAGIFLITKHKSFVPKEKPAAGRRNEVKRRGLFPVKDKTLYYFLFSLLPVYVVFFQVNATVSLYVVKNLGISEAVFGSLMAINTVMIIFIEVPLNNAIAKWPHSRALSLGALLCAIGFGGMVFATDVTGIIVTIVIWTFGEMVFFPSSAAYMSEISPPERIGEYMGYYQMIFSFSISFGPLIGTVVYQDYGPAVLWPATFILGLCAAMLMYKIKVRPAAERENTVMQDVIVNENTDE